MYMRLSVPSLCITSFGVFNLIHMILNESKKEDGFDEIRYLHFKCSFNALAHGKCELIQIANDYPMVMLIFPFRQLHKSTIQCIFNISHQLSGAVRHPPGHDLYSVCILIDDKLYNDTWNCSAFHKLFRTKFRFNIDEWICDLLHKKCSASIRKMVLHHIVCSVIISLGMKKSTLRFHIQYEHHAIVANAKRLRPNEKKNGWTRSTWNCIVPWRRISFFKKNSFNSFSNNRIYAILYHSAFYWNCAD